MNKTAMEARGSLQEQLIKLLQSFKKIISQMHTAFIVSIQLCEGVPLLFKFK